MSLPYLNGVSLSLEDNLNIERIVIRSTLTITMSIMLNGFFITHASAADIDIDKLTSTCADCHGKDGASTEPEIPIIGGYSAQYILDTIAAYSNKERPCRKTEHPTGSNKGQQSDMCQIAKKLSEQEASAIAQFYASKKFVPAIQEFDPKKAKLGKKVQKKCRKCHTDGGAQAEDDAGILAGQWSPYLRQQLKDYSSGERPMTEKMEKKYKKIDETDIENLIHYFASFQ